MDATFLFSDFAPLSGLQRTIFYVGLLVILLLDKPTPFNAPTIVGRVAEPFYTQSKALSFLVKGVPIVRLLVAARTLTIVFWCAAAAGFLQPYTAIGTFIGFAFLHSANSGALGSNHSTHAALYALFALCFSASGDAFSFDAVIAQHVPWPTISPDSVLQSGFALKLMQVTFVYIMVAGGLSKLRHGGLRWLSGKSLHFYVEGNAPFARNKFVSRLLVSSPRLCAVLATFSVVAELSGVLALVDTRFVPYVVLLWVCLHVGILLVMMPDYWVQMWCYTLLIDWGQLLGLGHAPRLLLEPHGNPAATALAVFFATYCVVLAYVFLRHIEEWPFTAVPMYSNGLVPSERPAAPRTELHARATRALGGDVKSWHRPWISTEADEEILVSFKDGREPMALFWLLAEHGESFARWSQWAKVVRSVVIEDVASKPFGLSDSSNRDGPASAFLRRLVPVLRERLPTAGDIALLEIVYRTAEGPLVVGAASMSVEERP